MNKKKTKEACIAAELDIIMKKEIRKQMISYHQFKLMNLQMK